MTAEATADSAMESAREGASGYLVKPFYSAKDVLDPIVGAMARSAARGASTERLRQSRPSTSRTRILGGAPMPGADLARVSVKLLVASRAESTRERARRAAEMGRWRMQVVATGAEALAVLREERYDAVLADETLGPEGVPLLVAAR